MKLALALAAALLPACLAIDREYQGFHHFRNWDGRWAQEVQVKLPFSTSGSTPVGDWKDLCTADTKCDTVTNGGSFAIFRIFNTTTDYDMFLGIKGEPGTAPAAFCSVEAGGGNAPDTQWLHCDNDEFLANSILLTFQLPPDLIHETCLKNPKCIGFRIRNDEGSGDILAEVDHAHGYFKLSNTHQMNASALKSN
jgi:hypothetical protein